MTDDLQPVLERAVVRNFERVFGRRPDLDNPTTFNEKVAYKILHDRRPILTRLQDKLQARDYVAERIGAEYLTEIYQVCRSPTEIEWQKLPRCFVIKMNHGYGMNIFITDKSLINVSVIAPWIEKWRALNFYYCWGEWAYRDIQPAILIEEMLTEENSGMPADWKIYTFDGRAEFLALNVDLLTECKVSFYDRRLTRLPLRRIHRPNLPEDPKFPHNTELMFSLADKLGSGLDFVRVDMYNLNGRIVFGEFTHYPGAGLDQFHPPEFDEIFGSKWRIPCRYE